MDRNAVAVMKEGQIVGHIPFNLSPIISLFLKAEALSSHSHVIALTETWIDSSISNHEIFIPGYSPIHRDRSRHGGGILLYISESLIINSTNINKTSELLFADLRLKHGAVMIGLYYRHPSSQSSALSDLESALESTPPAFMKNFVLLGDFNIDLLQPDSPSAIELTNITSLPLLGSTLLYHGSTSLYFTLL